MAALLPKCGYPENVALVVDRIQHAADYHFPNDCPIVRAFGSSVNGFGDSSSDIDLIVQVPGAIDMRDFLAGFQGALRWEGFIIKQRILHARVPILKLMYKGIECDLSCNNLLPVYNTVLLKRYADLDRRAVRLVQELKRWAKEKDVHGAMHGNFSSYAFTLLVIFYMQVNGALPCLQHKAGTHPEWYEADGMQYNVAMDLDISVPAGAAEIPLTLHGLLEWLALTVRWGMDVISVRTGRLASKTEFPELKGGKVTGMLHIEDPFDIQRNLNCVMSFNGVEKLRWALEAVVGETVNGEALPVRKVREDGEKGKGKGKGRRKGSKGKGKDGKGGKGAGASGEGWEGDGQGAAAAYGAAGGSQVEAPARTKKGKARSKDAAPKGYAAEPQWHDALPII